MQLTKILEFYSVIWYRKVTTSTLKRRKPGSLFSICSNIYFARKPINSNKAGKDSYRISYEFIKKVKGNFYQPICEVDMIVFQNQDHLNDFCLDEIKLVDRRKTWMFFIVSSLPSSEIFQHIMYVNPGRTIYDKWKKDVDRVFNLFFTVMYDGCTLSNDIKDQKTIQIIERILKPILQISFTFFIKKHCLMMQDFSLNSIFHVNRDYVENNKKRIFFHSIFLLFVSFTFGSIVIYLYNFLKNTYKKESLLLESNSLIIELIGSFILVILTCYIVSRFTAIVVKTKENNLKNTFDFFVKTKNSLVDTLSTFCDLPNNCFVVIKTYPKVMKKYWENESISRYDFNKTIIYKTQESALFYSLYANCLKNMIEKPLNGSIEDRIINSLVDEYAKEYLLVPNVLNHLKM